MVEFGLFVFGIIYIIVSIVVFISAFYSVITFLNGCINILDKEYVKNEEGLLVLKIKVNIDKSEKNRRRLMYNMIIVGLYLVVSIIIVIFIY